MITRTSKRWRLKAVPDPSKIAGLVSDRCPSELAELLAQRGIHTPAEASVYFRPDLSNLHDPFLMKDMDKAVERIERALGEGERIMIYGDYDVDGTTSVALVFGFLSRFTGNMVHYIPDRYAEGYGISTLGIDRAAEQGITLIIALDCGIKSLDKVAYATEKGIDFIICDHHLPLRRQLPRACEQVFEHRPPGDRVEHLVQVAFHAGALASGENDDGEWRG